MKSIVITGATSMIGIALINECVKNNVRVLAIVHSESVNRSRIPKSMLIEVIENHSENFDSIQHFDGSWDVFFHFGWVGTDQASRNNPIIQNLNIQYTLDAVNLAKRLGCKTFVGAGSQAEYGRNSKIISPQMPVHPETAYGVAKYAAGKLSGIHCQQIGLRYIWARIFSVYGIFDHESTLIMQCIRALLKNEKPSLTACEQKWDYLFSEDAGRAFFLIGDKGKDQAVYCVASGESKQLSEYVLKIRDLIDKKLQVGIGELNYSPDQIMNLRADISDLINDTGFQPIIKFEDGIKKIIGGTL